MSSIPLLQNSSAPMARFETDDESDDREVVTTSYPGVDDGFFENKDKNEPPDVERINPKPNRPKIPEIEVTNPTPEPPEFTPRMGPEGGTDETDKKIPVDEHRPLSPGSNRPFPSHGFGFDLENGSIPGLPGIDESIPDVNIYQHKKTLAQGMMDLALFSANANQLRYVLESYDRHPYFYPSVILISISLLLQVAVGIGLIWNATYNVKDDKEICIANRINNFTVIGIFLVTVINVFVSAFGVANPPS